MDSPSDREAVRLAVLFLRQLGRQSQEGFAAATGINRRMLSLYEQGEKRPRLGTLEAIAAAAGVTAARLDQLLVLFHQVIEERATGATPEGDAAESGERDRERRAATLAEEIAAAIEPRITEGLAAIEALITAPPEPLEPEAARTRAAQLWQRMAEVPEAYRPDVLELGPEFQTWAFCERLCTESREALSAGEAAKALGLAELALTAADLTPGSDGQRSRRQGYAWAHAAQAHRAAGNAQEARSAFERAETLWNAGEGSPEEPFPPPPLAELSAELRPN